MKNLMKRIKMRRAVSKRNSKSHDPIKAYKARLEVSIYSCLLDLIAKELEAQTLTIKPDETVTEVRTQAEVQVA